MILLPVQCIWYIIFISMVLVYLYMLEAFDLKHFDNDSLVYSFRQLKLQDIFYVLPFSNEYFGVSSKIFTIFNLKKSYFLMKCFQFQTEISNSKRNMSTWNGKFQFQICCLSQGNVIMKMV